MDHTHTYEINTKYDKITVIVGKWSHESKQKVMNKMLEAEDCTIHKKQYVLKVRKYFLCKFMEIKQK